MSTLTGARARSLLFGALLAFGILGVALVALRQPAGGGDYVAIWGLKARAIARAGTLSALFRVDPSGIASPPEYPPLWPLTLASFSAVAGRYDDLVVTLLWPLLALLAALLAVRVTRTERPERLLAGAGIALLPYFRTPIYIGYAEALLVVLLLAALAETDRLEHPAAKYRLALFLSMAALTKLEGGLAAAVFVAVLIGARRLRPAALAFGAVLLIGILPFALYRRSQQLSVALRDFSATSFHPEKFLITARALGAEALLPHIPWLLGASLLLLLAPVTRRRRSPVLIGAMLYTGALFVSYSFSHHDAAWHVRWSWDRLALVPIALLIPVLVEAASESISLPAKPAPAG